MAENATGGPDVSDRALLLELLTAAAAAHGIHEETELGGVYDENWPEWYADHMAAALAARGLSFTAPAASASPSA